MLFLLLRSREGVGEGVGLHSRGISPRFLTLAEFLGPTPSGHYTLKIHEPIWNNSDYFEVEIKSLPTITASVLIDISPIHPDCTGGHKSSS